MSGSGREARSPLPPPLLSFAASRRRESSMRQRMSLTPFGFTFARMISWSGTVLWHLSSRSSSRVGRPPGSDDGRSVIGQSRPPRPPGPAWPSGTARRARRKARPPRACRPSPARHRAIRPSGIRPMPCGRGAPPPAANPCATARSPPPRSADGPPAPDSPPRSADGQTA